MTLSARMWLPERLIQAAVADAVDAAEEALTAAGAAIMSAEAGQAMAGEAAGVRLCRKSYFAVSQVKETNI